MEARLPVSLTVSLALHAGGLVGWLALNSASTKAVARVISNVDILTPVRRLPTAAQARPAAARPVTSWDILKLALPTLPRVQAPLEIQTPRAEKKLLLDAPEKLDDKGRLKKAALLEPLDLGKKRADLASLDAAKLETRRRTALAELPKLEEVGSRRAPKKALALDALAEEARGRLAPEDLAQMSMPDPKRSRSAPALAMLEEEARPEPRRSTLSKMADMLASAPPLALEPRGAVEPVRRTAPLKVATLPEKRETAALEGAKKRSIEIEGPLANRKVVSYEIPSFPSWAAAQGVVEAEARIRFFVDPSGAVQTEMRVEATSGYGALDRLAMDSLKRWRFEPLAGSTGRQWGIITFRFVLE